jgi:hypothetical protein
MGGLGDANMVRCLVPTGFACEGCSVVNSHPETINVIVFELKKRTLSIVAFTYLTLPSSLMFLDSIYMS